MNIQSFELINQNHVYESETLSPKHVKGLITKAFAVAGFHWQRNILSLKQIVYRFLLKVLQSFHSKFLQQVRLLTKLIMKGTIWLVESHLKFVMRRLMNYWWVRMGKSDLTHGWWRERNVSESTECYRRWALTNLPWKYKWIMVMISCCDILSWHYFLYL
jgi:hypothetical protein